MRTRFWSLGLLLTLGACTPPPLPDLSGAWRDRQAVAHICGETSPVEVGLDLIQEGAYLGGTFTLQGTEFAFEGEVNATAQLFGDVRSDDGDGLDAALAHQGGRLVGTFTATEAVGCTDGTPSVTVYKVVLARQ